MAKQVFLVLTNNINRPVIKHFNEIKNGAKEFGETYFLYHRRGAGELPPWLNQKNCYAFTDDILERLNYIPWSATLLPGSNHFPLLDYYRNILPKRLNMR